MKQSKQNRNKKRILKELELNHIASHAYKRAGISHATYYRWLNEDDRFRLDTEKAQRIGKSFLVDYSESKLFENISKNDLGAIKFFLSHNEPRYRPHIIRAHTEYTDKLESRLWVATETLNHLINIVGLKKFTEILGFDSLEAFEQAAEEEQKIHKLRTRPKKQWMPYPGDSDFPDKKP